MTEFVGFLVRSTGIVAALLAIMALMWGLFFSARATGHRLRPAWWLDLHNWLGGLAMIFTAVHIGLSLADGGSGIGVAQALIPGTAAGDRWGIGLGVVAAYLLAIAVLTTWPRRLANRRLWRVLHVGSVIGGALALTHAYVSGSDAGRISMLVGILLCVSAGAYAVAVRLLGLVERRRAVSADSQPTHS